MSYTYSKSKIVHIVRNRQDEYVGKEHKNVVVLEFACGRKVREEQATKIDLPVSCKTCLKSVK